MRPPSFSSRRLSALFVASLLAVDLRALDTVAPAPAAEPAPAPAIKESKEAPWLVPTFDARLRYEHADIAPLEAANALTLRIRPGVLLRAPKEIGLSAFVEGEGTYALVREFDAAPGTAARPHHPERAQINDPDNLELNQAYLREEYGWFLGTVGRQRIVLDNAAFVGNIAWRQNEQTFDAVDLQAKTSKSSTLRYAYSYRVNRIFGEYADGIRNHFDGDMHFVNFHSADIAHLDVTAYAYLMDFDGAAGGLSNQSYGGKAAYTFDAIGGFTPVVSQEAAWQADMGSATAYSAWYGHTIFGLSREEHKISVAYEHLGSNKNISFRTPLATAHAFNGFADALLPARVNGAKGGLGDFYATYDFPLPLKITGQLAYHLFGADDFSFDYGHEVDLVFKRKFDAGFSSLVKLAKYEASTTPGSPAPFDTMRLSFEVDFAY